MPTASSAPSSPSAAGSEASCELLSTTAKKNQPSPAEPTAASSVGVSTSSSRTRFCSTRGAPVWSSWISSVRRSSTPTTWFSAVEVAATTNAMTVVRASPVRRSAAMMAK